MPSNVNAQVKYAPEDSTYHAFLLRCWQESPPVAGEESTWRFSLIHIDGLQTKKGFACLEDLLDYLQEEVAKWDGEQLMSKTGRNF